MLHNRPLCHLSKSLNIRGFVVFSLSLWMLLTPALTPTGLISSKETPSRVNGRVSVTPPRFKPEVILWRSLAHRRFPANPPSLRNRMRVFRAFPMPVDAGRKRTGRRFISSAVEAVAFREKSSPPTIWQQRPRSLWKSSTGSGRTCRKVGHPRRSTSATAARSVICATHS